MQISGCGYPDARLRDSLGREPAEPSVLLVQDLEHLVVLGRDVAVLQRRSVVLVVY